MERVPEFWEWLVHKGAEGQVKIIQEVYEEIAAPEKKKEDKDELSIWVELSDTKEALLFGEAADVDLVRRVTAEGYAPDLTDDELEKLGRDPFLIAYALASPADRCIVTTEVSKPSTQRANRKIPDACQTMGVQACDTFQFVRDLDFSTNWKKK